MNTIDSMNELNQLYLYVHRTNDTVRLPDWSVDRVDRPYTVFWYVFSGEKSIKVNDIQYEVQAGDLVVFPSQLPFEVIKNNNSITMHHYDIAIENKWGPFNLFSLYKFPIITNLEKNSIPSSRLLQLWSKLIEQWNPKQMTQFTPTNGEITFDLSETIDLLKFNSLSIEWFAELLTILSPFSDELSPTFDSRLQYLFHYISDHLSEKLSLNTLAKQVYLSESHLSLLFRQNVNISPMEYVRQVRMQKARELLLTTNLPLKEITEIIGFDGQSQLSRAFRQATGLSPSIYRQKGTYF
ncbi:helix-turn-helix domain-containing protein [Bacillus sp. FJAT-45350]|uniref:helix-turn-helix domain-containing protein n=1 Tax=Bacillus sp. FJAT-45350 TaxID=2011014 RepID=UPI000BB75A97|nr:AraC family transcriptional regulator [Bacillus sp. FJAT-45350]